MAHEIYLGWQETTPGRGSADGRKLLSALYHQVTGQTMPELIRETTGKPRFAAGPWHCSISHTRQAVFCALSLTPIGLDAEPLNRKVGERIMERALSPMEQARLEEYPTKEEGFLTHWVLKEAYGKYTGYGIRGNLAELDFRVAGDRAQLTGESLRFVLRRFFGHILAICRDEPGEIVVISENLKKSL